MKSIACCAKGSVNANQVAAEGKNAQYNSDDSKDGDRPFGKGGIGLLFASFCHGDLRERLAVSSLAGGACIIGQHTAAVDHSALGG